MKRLQRTSKKYLHLKHNWRLLLPSSVCGIESYLFSKVLIILHWISIKQISSQNIYGSLQVTILSICYMTMNIFNEFLNVQLLRFEIYRSLFGILVSRTKMIFNNKLDMLLIYCSIQNIYDIANLAFVIHVKY